MNPIKLKGIVIRRTNVGDYDRMLTILTAEMGKLSVFAKGARSSRRGAQGIDLLCYSEFVLKPHRDIYTLGQSTIIEGFYHLRDSVEKLAYGAYFADLAGKVLGEFEGSADLMRLLLNTLYFLANKNSPPPSLRLFFELKALAEAGFEPQLSECVYCGEREGLTFLDVGAGGAACAACKPAGAIKLSSEAIGEMQRVLALSLKDAINHLPSQETEKEVEGAIEKFIEEHIGAVPKTLGYLKTIVG